MKLPPEIKKIIDTFEAAGYEAYAVGGCVRDGLMNKIPNDWDVATSAPPEAIKKLFVKTFDTGIKHGTVTIIMNDLKCEATTYRIDGAYLDGRRPSEVFFTGDLTSDLKRRDFTINAIAYHPRRGVVDPWGGADDIINKIIRGVGDADERFREDALRMLRAVRFSAATGFTIEPATAEAIKINAPSIRSVSNERVRDEFIKILCADYPDRLPMLNELGLVEHISPLIADIIKKHSREIVRGLNACANDLTLRLALFFRFTEADAIRATMRSLRFDNVTAGRVPLLTAWINNDVARDAYSVKRALASLGPDMLDAALYLKEIAFPAESTAIEKTREIKKRVTDDAECYSLSALAVTGADIIERTNLRGSDIGAALKFLLDEAMRRPELNDKETLLKVLSRTFSSPPPP